MKAAASLLGGLVLAAAAVGPAAAETAIDPAVWQAAGVTAVPPVRVPALTLPDLSGRARHLADLKGRVVMLYFWATW